MSVLEKVPFEGSEECESTHYVVGAWSHSTVIPASSQQKNTPLKGLLSLQSNSAIIMSDHNSELELFTDDVKCIKHQMYQAATGQSFPESVTWSIFKRKLQRMEE